MRNSQIKPLISLAGAFYLRGMSKVAKGNFGCTAAPLNREQKGRSLFVFHLACLLTALLLALPHCSSDDNGSGGGGGSDEDSPPADAPPAALSAIYLWVTGCTVQGDMNGGTCSDPAGAPTNGPERADAICADRYEADVDETSRNRIAEEGNPRHTAMLARSDDPPREVFPVRGKDTLPIQRPDGTTLIADSWDQFLDPSVDLSAAGGASVSAASVNYWTGWWLSTGVYTPATSSVQQFYCNGPSNMVGAYWTSSTAMTNDIGRYGNSSAVDTSRIATNGDACQSLHNILCITH